MPIANYSMGIAFEVGRINTVSDFLVMWEKGGFDPFNRRVVVLGIGGEDNASVTFGFGRWSYPIDPNAVFDKFVESCSIFVVNYL